MTLLPGQRPSIRLLLVDDHPLVRAACVPGWTLWHICAWSAKPAMARMR